MKYHLVKIYNNTYKYHIPTIGKPLILNKIAKSLKYINVLKMQIQCLRFFVRELSMYYR